MVGGAFGAQKAFLDIVSKAKKPSDLEIEKLLKPTSDKIKEIQVNCDLNMKIVLMVDKNPKFSLDFSI